MQNIRQWLWGGVVLRTAKREEGGEIHCRVLSAREEETLYKSRKLSQSERTIRDKSQVLV